MASPRLSLAAPPTEVRRPRRLSRAVLRTRPPDRRKRARPILFAFGNAGPLHGALSIHRWLVLYAASTSIRLRPLGPLPRIHFAPAWMFHCASSDQMIDRIRRHPAFT